MYCSTCRHVYWKYAVLVLCSFSRHVINGVRWKIKDKKKTKTKTDIFSPPSRGDVTPLTPPITKKAWRDCVSLSREEETATHTHTQTCVWPLMVLQTQHGGVPASLIQTTW